MFLVFVAFTGIMPSPQLFFQAKLPLAINPTFSTKELEVFFSRHMSPAVLDKYISPGVETLYVTRTAARESGSRLLKTITALSSLHTLYMTPMDAETLGPFLSGIVPVTQVTRLERLRESGWFPKSEDGVFTSLQNLRVLNFEPSVPDHKQFAAMLQALPNLESVSSRGLFRCEFTGLLPPLQALTHLNLYVRISDTTDFEKLFVAAPNLREASLELISQVNNGTAHHGGFPESRRALIFAFPSSPAGLFKVTSGFKF